MLALYLAFLFIGFLKEKEKVQLRKATIPPHTISAKVSRETIPRIDGKQESDEHLVELSEQTISVEPLTDGSSKLDGTASYKQIARFKREGWKDAFFRVFPEFLPFALNTISLMFVFWCLSILYVPYKTRKEKHQQRRMVYFSGLVVFFLIICYPLLLNLAKVDEQFSDQNLLEYTTMFNAISGTLNGVVVALLIARLDSKLIGLPSLLVSILYLYAGVQPLFVVFSQQGLVNEIIKTVVLLFVFILKIYFFLIILYGMQTGRILNYMFCFPTLNSRVNSIFDNRFQITIKKESTNSYGFVITKNRSVVYEANHSFRNRDKCIAEIETLRGLMGNGAAYNIKSSKNSVMVEVSNDKEDVRCTSVDLESNEEAEALIRASIDNVPYCKLEKLKS